MNTVIKHSQMIAQPKLGVLAYWSAICESMFNSNDRGTEIRTQGSERQ